MGGAAIVGSRKRFLIMRSSWDVFLSHPLMWLKRSRNNSLSEFPDLLITAFSNAFPGYFQLCSLSLLLHLVAGFRYMEVGRAWGLIGISGESLLDALLAIP